MRKQNSWVQSLTQNEVSSSPAAAKLEHMLKHNKIIEERRRVQFSVDDLLTDSEVNPTTELINHLKARIVDIVPSPVNYHCEYTKDYVQRMYNMQRNGTLLVIKKIQIH